jgi:hypothetical protein
MRVWAPGLHPSRPSGIAVIGGRWPLATLATRMEQTDFGTAVAGTNLDLVRAGVDAPARVAMELVFCFSELCSGQYSIGS